jgi:micrococcal nuclease
LDSTQEKIIMAALAWRVKKYAPNNQVLASLHAQARAEYRGLWQNSNPKPPWRYPRTGK